MLRPWFNHTVIEAGLDEVGRGCLAGPVVAAAVILPKDFAHPLIQDSKQLTKELRIELREVIIESALGWAIAEASPQEIDEINILKASFLAMHRALEQLSLRPEHLLVDGNRFTPYPGIPHTCIVKGDTKFASIAAASILAKTYRDELMTRLGEQYAGYAWETNAGYPTPAHKRAIAAQGPTPWHRRSFRWS